MIDFTSVTKRYGKTIALDDFSITMKQHGIYCLLGRNGAGKTTFLKALSGHIAINSGKIIVNDSEVTQLNMPNNICFVESCAKQFNMKLDDLLKAAASINPQFDISFALRIADEFELDKKKRYKQLSFGMKVMVNTLLALSSGKEILLLDEPVLGFDPIMRKNFYEMLQESNADNSKTIIVSTHIIDEISKVANQTIIIHKGKMIQFCDMTELDEKAYCVTGLDELVRTATKGLRILSEMKVGGFLSQYIYDVRVPQSDNYSITVLSLQEFFIALVGNEKEVQ